MVARPKTDLIPATGMIDRVLYRLTRLPAVRAVIAAALIIARSRDESVSLRPHPPIISCHDHQRREHQPNTRPKDQKPRTPPVRPRFRSVHTAPPATPSSSQVIEPVHALQC